MPYVKVVAMLGEPVDGPQACLNTCVGDCVTDVCGLCLGSLCLLHFTANHAFLLLNVLERRQNVLKWMKRKRELIFTFWFF